MVRAAKMLAMGLSGRLCTANNSQERSHKEECLNIKCQMRETHYGSCSRGDHVAAVNGSR